MEQNFFEAIEKQNPVAYATENYGNYSRIDLGHGNRHVGRSLPRPPGDCSTATSVRTARQLLENRRTPSFCGNCCWWNFMHHSFALALPPYAGVKTWVSRSTPRFGRKLAYYVLLLQAKENNAGKDKFKWAAFFRSPVT